MHQAMMQAVVVTDKASYAVSEEAAIIVSATDGAGPAEGVALYVEVTNAFGEKSAGRSVTGADGMANLTCKIEPRRDGIGTYTVDAIGSKDGFEPASASTTFEVDRKDDTRASLQEGNEE